MYAIPAPVLEEFREIFLTKTGSELSGQKLTTFALSVPLLAGLQHVPAFHTGLAAKQRPKYRLTALSTTDLEAKYNYLPVIILLFLEVILSFNFKKIWFSK